MAAHGYVDRLVDAGVIKVIDAEWPRRYAIHEVNLIVMTVTGDHRYTIIPALIDVVGRNTTNVGIDTYIDRHGVAGLATALTYATARRRGEVTHRLMGEDTDISPLAAEMIPQALRPVVYDYHDIKETGVSLDEVAVGDGQSGVEGITHWTLPTPSYSRPWTSY